MQLQCEHERVHIGAARHDDTDDTDNALHCHDAIEQQLIVCVHAVDHVDRGR